MPVYKFRSVEEMEDDRRKWSPPDTPELWNAIRHVWRLAALTRHRYPAGVYKHRSIEALNRLTDEWERRNVRRINGLG